MRLIMSTTIETKYVQNTIKSKQLYYEKPPHEVVTVEIEGQKDTSTIIRSGNHPHTTIL